MTTGNRSLCGPKHFGIHFAPQRAGTVDTKGLVDSARNVIDWLRGERVSVITVIPTCNPTSSERTWPLFESGKTQSQLEYAHKHGIRYIILVAGQWRIVYPLVVVK